MAYFDTSVLTAYYYPEPLSAQAEHLICSDAEPTISTLSAVEFVSATSRKIREKTLSMADGQRIIELFETHQTEGFYSIKPLDHSHYATASNFIKRFSTPLRTLDALHLAVSWKSSQILVTADKHLAESGKALGVSVELVR